MRETHESFYSRYPNPREKRSLDNCAWEDEENKKKICKKEYIKLTYDHDLMRYRFCMLYVYT